MDIHRTGRLMNIQKRVRRRYVVYPYDISGVTRPDTFKVEYQLKPITKAQERVVFMNQYN